MAAAVFVHQRQLGKRPHRPVTAQDSIYQLEQRIATKAARAVLAWGFGTLGLGQITAMIHHGNTPSTAVARRPGFTPLREDNILGRPCTVYALSSDDFAASEDRTTTASCPDTPRCRFQ
ncbi:GNAT family N-acetyltransferase [Streptomyces hygroscopicus]|uniref:GNAT family N-acetyltransferase n=1 Tax=Streptomyces hygroscopicus TaxID=1912 RepID=UPI0036C2B70E